MLRRDHRSDIHGDRFVFHMVFYMGVLLLSSRSPPESVSTGLLMLHGGDGGEAEPAESLGHERSRLHA